MLIFFLFSDEVMSIEDALSLPWCEPNRLSISNLPLLGMSPRLPWSEAEVILGLSRPLCWEFSRASSTEFPGASVSLFPATGLCRPLSINIISFLIRSIIKQEGKGGEETLAPNSAAPVSCSGAKSAFNWATVSK